MIYGYLMNELLNLKIRDKKTGELFFVTGFSSAGDSRKSFIVTIGIKSCEGKKGSFAGRSYGLAKKEFENYELFSSIGDF